MANKIKADDCKHMFDDRFDYLTNREIGLELKHYKIGTAPENPSFLVNQEEQKTKIKELFTSFFDQDSSLGLELLFLQSNYGNGKSHFLRMITAFLNKYENVNTKRIIIRQEEIDLKAEILKAISQNIIIQCADYIISEVEEAIGDDRTLVVTELTDKYQIQNNLAELLYSVAKETDISRKAQAIAIIKGNESNDYLRNFNMKKNDKTIDFNSNAIRLVCKYLVNKSQYLVVVFDEYEHIYVWKSAAKRRKFYADLKEFTDNLQDYSNLFIIFGESLVEEGSNEQADDPAFYSRKIENTIRIEDISSDEDINKLFAMILKRYQKYYDIDFGDSKIDLLNKVKENPEDKVASNYRAYAKNIIKVLDGFRENGRPKKNSISNRNQQQSVDLANWQTITSISKKSVIFDTLLAVLNKDQEVHIEYKSKKYGELVVRNETARYAILIVVTERPSLNDAEKRYAGFLTRHPSEEIGVFLMLYPMFQDEDHEYIKAYDLIKIPDALTKINSVEVSRGTAMNTIINAEWV